jgi:hypothetical protein
MIATMTRKVYVLGYDPIPVDDNTEQRRQEWKVGYCAVPEWTFADRSAAEIECGYMRGWDVRMEDGHRCDFAVETMDSGGFAIVCLSHPEHLKLSPGTSKTLLLNTPARLTEVAEQRGMSVQAVKEHHARLVVDGKARFDGTRFISLDEAGNEREPIIIDDSEGY